MQYLLGRLFPTKANKTHTNQRTLQVFLLCRLETSQKPSKVVTGKTLFSSVYVTDATCFNECFLFHMITGRWSF